MTEDRTMSLNAVLELIETCNSSGLTGIFCSYDDGKRFADMIKKLPPVTSNDEDMAMQYQRGFIDGFKEGKATFEPKTGRCKDCKWWKDSDGAYRRGIRAESQCPINRREVFEGNGYCYMYEPQERSE